MPCVGIEFAEMYVITMTTQRQADQCGNQSSISINDTVKIILYIELVTSNESKFIIRFNISLHLYRILLNI